MAIKRPKKNALAGSAPMVVGGGTSRAGGLTKARRALAGTSRCSATAEKWALDSIAKSPLESHPLTLRNSLLNLMRS